VIGMAAGRLWAIVLAGCMISQSMYSQDPTLTFYKSRGETSIRAFRKIIRSALTPEQRQVEQTINYQVLATSVANAVAYEDALGGRYIDLGVGLLMMYENVAVDGIIGQAGYRNCAIAYEDYLFSSLNANSQLALSHIEQMQNISMPFVFASSNPACSGVTPAILTEHPERQAAFKGFVGASIHLTLAHELGHHLQGHVRRGGTENPLQTSRGQEANADRFAFESFAKCNINPLQALPAFTFLLFTGGPREDEMLFDHPSGPSRFEPMLNTMTSLTEDPQFRAMLARTQQELAWLNCLRELHSEGHAHNVN
jgi:hypothetical protein